VEYHTARNAFEQSPERPDGIYIPCGGWGSMHNIDPLERDLDTKARSAVSASCLRRSEFAATCGIPIARSIKSSILDKKYTHRMFFCGRNGKTERKSMTARMPQ
jgi:hypothetical protein